ncbi:hypothetical protein DIPPA_26630 [Diplonema papillatum]|nr:hypothetical protein DIPPA_26630 [Diplonema papillatum]
MAKTSAIGWSSFYDEDADNFAEFQQFEVADDMPMRQLSGSVVEEEAAKEWEEDWEDEDKEDTYAYISSRIVDK